MKWKSQIIKLHNNDKSLSFISISVPPLLSPKFSGTCEFTFAEFTSKLVTMQSRCPESLKTDVDRINYAL